MKIKAQQFIKALNWEVNYISCIILKLTGFERVLFNTDIF